MLQLQLFPSTAKLFMFASTHGTSMSSTRKGLGPDPVLIQVRETLCYGLNKLEHGSVTALAKGHVMAYRQLKGLLLINFFVLQSAVFPQITNTIKLDLFQSVHYAFAHLSFLHLLSPVIYFIVYFFQE